MYKKISALAAVLLLQTGCATIKVQDYSPSYDNFQLLSSAQQPVGIDPFTSQNSAIGKVSIRSNTLSSAQGDNLNAYLQHALQTELEKAQLFNNDSPFRLTAAVQENTVDAEVGEGHGHIAAQFIVRKDNKQLYSKLVRVDDAWESSFVGAVAIPRAVAAYPTLVKKLLRQLFADPDFIAALSAHS